MKKEYRKTLVSSETGCEWAQKFFLEGETDKAKSNTVKLNKMKWMPIKEPVKEWVQENWWTWKEETPDWFTDAWIAKVPDDFLPAEENRVALQKLRIRHTVFGGSGGGDEKNRRLSQGGGGGGAATIVPVAGAAEDAGTKGSGAKVVGVLKAIGEGSAGADESGAAKNVAAEAAGATMSHSAVSGYHSGCVDEDEKLEEEEEGKKKTTKVREKRAGVEALLDAVNE
jgi:hypothetical protein